MSQKSKETDKDEDGPAWWRATSIALIVLAVGAAVWSVWYVGGVLHFRNFTDGAHASNYGESFGAVNALISAMALAGVVTAIFLQMKELSLQRRELRLTKNELAKSADAQTELVHLSAMSTLLQTYLEEFRTNPREYNIAFSGLLMSDPAKAEEHIVHKISVCRALLEQMYNTAAGQSLGKPVETSIEGKRRRHWASEFYRAAAQLSNQWKGFDKQIKENTPPRIIKVGEAVDGFTERLADLWKWSDSLPNRNGWENEFQLLQQSARELQPPAGSDDSWITTRNEQGQMLAERAIDLATRVWKQLTGETIKLDGEVPPNPAAPPAVTETPS